MDKQDRDTKPVCWGALNMKLEIGDTVAYSAAWLRSTGQITGDAGRRRGKVVAHGPIDPARFVTVAWEGGAYCDEHDCVDSCPRPVAIGNLAKPGANRRFCNVD